MARLPVLITMFLFAVGARAPTPRTTDGASRRSVPRMIRRVPPTTRPRSVTTAAPTTTMPAPTIPTSKVPTSKVPTSTVPTAAGTATSTSAPLAPPTPSCVADACFAVPFARDPSIFPPLVTNDAARAEAIPVFAKGPVVAALVVFVDDNREVRAVDLRDGTIRTVVSLPMSGSVEAFLAIGGRPHLGVVRRDESGWRTAVDLIDLRTGSSTRHIEPAGQPCRVTVAGVWTVVWNGHTQEGFVRRVGWDGQVNSPWFPTPKGAPICNGVGRYLVLGGRAPGVRPQPTRVVDTETLIASDDEVAAIGNGAAESYLLASTDAIQVRQRGADLIVRRRGTDRVLAVGVADGPSSPSALSPDATKFATFLRRNDAQWWEPPTALIVIDLVTTQARRHDVAHNGSLHWAPDGSKLLVGLPNGVMVLDPTSGDRSVVDFGESVPFGKLVAVIAA